MAVGERVEGRRDEGDALSRRLRRAWLVVEGRGVKLYRFEPSGREIWSVVGLEADQIINMRMPYCSCEDFYFRFLTGRERTLEGGIRGSRAPCYHLLAGLLARDLGLYDLVRLSDEEMPTLLILLLKDLRDEARGRVRHSALRRRLAEKGPPHPLHLSP